MKKILFISNISRKITNFSIPSICAAQKLGFEFHMAANYSEFDNTSNKYGVHIHNVDINRNPLSLENYKAYRQLMKLIEEYEIDFIHCNTPTGGVLGRLCGKNSPRIKKVLYTAHGFHFYEGAPLLNNTVLKSAEKIMARYTDAMITMNSEDYIAAQDFRLKNNGKVFFVPGVGVNTKQYQSNDIPQEKYRKLLNLSDQDIVLISMGDLINRKNYESSIKAIAQLKNKNIKYLICGTGPNLKALVNLADKLEIKKQVHFLGYRNDVKELLSLSDIFLFTTYQEGLPRSMMEAMSAGLPVVASKVRGNVDLIEDGKGGYLKKPNDIEGLSEAIRVLIENESLRKQMGNHNKESIKEYDVENVKEKMVDIYRTLYCLNV